MKTKIALFVSLIVFAMTACSNVVEDWDETLLEINFRQETLPATLKYKIEVDGPTNLIHESQGAENVRVKISVGHYAISVTAFSDDIDGTKYASGDGEITVKTGQYSINITLDRAGGVATPTAIPDAGTYTSPQNIFLFTTTDGAKIYYTLDGSDPDPGNPGNLYTGPFIISDSGLTILKVIAAKDGVESSLILTVEYSIVIINTVWINAGTFLMGSPESEPNRNDSYGVETQHEVTLSKGFYMSRYLVTQKQYEAVTGNNPSYFQGTYLPYGLANGDNLPVERVTWYDAIEFCNKLSKLEGLEQVYTITNRNPASGYPITSATITADTKKNGYRLPAEAEWEYACRAGTTTPFSTGNNITTDQANYNGNYPYDGNPIGTYRGTTTEVGNFVPNAWGLYDMHGNVQEWCEDVYSGYIPLPINPPSGREGPGGPGVPPPPNVVFRGGAWDSYGDGLRSAWRGSSSAAFYGNNRGFRLVRSP